MNGPEAWQVVLVVALVMAVGAGLMKTLIDMDRQIRRGNEDSECRIRRF